MLERRWTTDAGLAVLLAVVAFVPGNGAFGVQLGGLPTQQLDTFGVVLVLGQSLPLAVRRSHPAVSLAAVTLAFAVHQALGHPTTAAGLGLLVALYSAGAHLPRARRTTMAATCAGYVVLAVVLHGRGSPQRPVDFATFALVLAASWGAGAWVRSWAAGETVRRRREAEQAVAGERARLARELHDVVTHHVTAMVVQAEAAQISLRADPGRAATSLAAISDTGRAAMVDLRSLLGVLAAPTGAPAHAGVATATDHLPAVRSLTDLVDRARSAGQPVDLVQAGVQRAEAAGVLLAVHRVVQEGLTNALRHARGAPTLVRVEHRPDAVDVTVTTGAPSGAAAGTGRPSRGPGRGLTGLQERVRVLGGQCDAGPGPDGSFTVRASIPAADQR